MASLSSLSKPTIDLSATSSSPSDLNTGGSAVEKPFSPQPHAKYYFPDGSVTFLVEKTLFRVHRFFFERESEIFQNLFAYYPFFGPQDDTIIPLTECACKDFESLLQILYNEEYGRYSFSKDSWKSVMTLSFQWQMSKIFEFAKSRIKKLSQDPIELVELQVKYAIEPAWALDAYLQLVQRPQPLSLDEAKRLGLETMVIIQMAKSDATGLAFTTAAAKVQYYIRQVYGRGEEVVPTTQNEVARSAVRQEPPVQPQARVEQKQDPTKPSPQAVPDSANSSHSDKVEPILPTRKNISPIPTGSGNDTSVPRSDRVPQEAPKEFRAADRPVGQVVSTAPSNLSNAMAIHARLTERWKNELFASEEEAPTPASPIRRGQPQSMAPATQDFFYPQKRLHKGAKN